MPCKQLVVIVSVVLASLLYESQCAITTLRLQTLFTGQPGAWTSSTMGK